MAAVAAMSMDAAVDRLIHFPDTSQLEASPQLGEARRAKSCARWGTVDQIKMLGKARFENAVALMQWWIGRMITTPAPLQEKMTLFWHGHFTSAYQGKGITAQDILAQNQLYRSYALGNIRKLALAVSHDPAMLKYLDNRANRGAASE